MAEKASPPEIYFLRHLVNDSPNNDTYDCPDFRYDGSAVRLVEEL
jgi:hypothetical protein